MTILAWVAQTQKFLIASHIPWITRSTQPPLTWRVMWPNIGTYWQNNYNLMGRTPWIGNISDKFLSVLMVVLIHWWLHITSFVFFLILGMWKSTPMSFKIIKFLIFTCDKADMFIVGLKEDVRNNPQRRWWALGRHQLPHSLCSHIWCHLCSRE